MCSNAQKMKKIVKNIVKIAKKKKKTFQYQEK